MENQVFETNAYKSNLASISSLLYSINLINLSDELKTYLLNKNLIDIEVNDMLAQIKIAKGTSLPNFDQYLAAGINLTNSVPDNPATISALKELYAVKRLSSGDARWVKYTATGWVINAAGSAFLTNSKVTLTTKQLSLYNAVKALHLQLADCVVSGYDFKRVLSEDVVGFNGTTFKDADLIDNIKKFNK